LSGNTISFLEFVQALNKSRSLLNEIYEPVFNKRIFQVYDQLKEIAAEQNAASMKDQIKRAKTKKGATTTTTAVGGAAAIKK
jgi:hypothetical protein